MSPEPPENFNRERGNPAEVVPSVTWLPFGV